MGGLPFPEKLLRPGLLEKAEPNGLPLADRPPKPVEAPPAFREPKPDETPEPRPPPKTESIVFEVATGGNLESALTPPNGLADPLEAPRAPKPEVEDWASLLKADASKADFEVSRRGDGDFFPDRAANGDVAERFPKALDAGSCKPS